MSESFIPCPYCDKPAVRTLREVRVRRGDRVAPVEMDTWECPSGCAGPDGEVPFQFIDRALALENDASARAAWLARFGEALPPSRRPGRKPPEKRVVPLHVLLTPSEERELDQMRGTISRSEFIRTRIFGSGPAGARRATP